MSTDATVKKIQGLLDNDYLAWLPHLPNTGNTCQQVTSFIRTRILNGLRETHVPWDSVISDCSFDDCLVRFQDIFFSTVDQFIPQVMLRRRSRPPWISNEIMKFIRKKRKLWRQMKACGSVDLYLKFKEDDKETYSLKLSTVLKNSVCEVKGRS